MADVNAVIGGVPEFLYLDLKAFGGLAGRGGAVRFFMLRHGITYDEKLVAFGDWLSTRKEEVAPLNPLGHLPIVTVNGQALTEHHAIMRRFSKQVGEYGSDIDRDYLADRIASASNEWRDLWASALSDPAAKEKYLAKRPEFYKIFAKYLEMQSAASGYVVGGEPSFADDLMFALLWDDVRGNGADDLAAHPGLQAFYDAYLAQPAISEWCSAALAE